MRMYISKIALAALLLAFSFTMLNCQSNAAKAILLMYILILVSP